MFEVHYRPKQLAVMWALSESTIVRWFRDEPVLKCSSPKRPGQRARVEIRIPESVAVRVYRERFGKIYA